MPYTEDTPKCLVELAGKPLLQHQIDALKAAGVEDIHIVTGYRAEQITAMGFRTRVNPLFAETNMVASLMCAASLLDGSDDVLIAYSDIVYEPRLIRELQGCNVPLATVVDRQWRRQWEMRFADPLADAETLQIDSEGHITEIGHHPESFDQIEGQYVGLTKVSAGRARDLREFHQSIAQAGMNVAKMDMTTFLRVLLAAGWPLQAVCVDGGWLEVDAASDLELYRGLYERGELDAFWHVETPSEVCA
jgi:choline kinase